MKKLYEVKCPKSKSPLPPLKKILYPSSSGVATIETLQEALVDERITTDQFFEVLVDNYGLKKATDIMVHNLNSCDGKFFPWE